MKLPLAPTRHDFIHAGLGLPVVPHSSSVHPEGEWRKLKAMAVASQADALVRAAADPDLELGQMWATGLPRHDFLLAERLPADLAAEEDRLREEFGWIGAWKGEAVPQGDSPEFPDREVCRDEHEESPPF